MLLISGADELELSTSAGGAVMALSSKVTAPVSARSRPSKSDAPVSAVMDVWARMFPSKALPVPSVAELPICQKTLMPGVEEPPSLIVTTELPDAVVRVDPIWKTNCASGLPWSSRVSVPVSSAEEEKK